MPELPKTGKPHRLAGFRAGQALQRFAGACPRGIVRSLLAAVLISGVALAGCGRKGPPVPPVDERKPVKEESRLHRPEGHFLSSLGLTNLREEQPKKGRISIHFRHFSSF